MDTPARPSELQELEAVVSSGILARNPNLVKFLQYICQKHFEGAADDIKEYNIAVDVYGRGVDFDRRQDSIVRVEASRLRKRLQEYYAAEGRDHALQLTIPTGQYAPCFVPAEVRIETPRGGWRLRYRRWIAAAALCALVLAAAAVYRMARPRNSTAIPLPVATSIPRPATAALAPEVRIIAGYAKPDHMDPEGHLWLGDRYYTGGFAGTTSDDNAFFVDGALDATLFRTQRWGNNFSYDIPMPPGVYEVRVFFAETQYGPELPPGGGESSRVMDVSINGHLLAPQMDVYAEAGGHHRAYARVFKDISPAENGKVHIAFQGHSEAFVNAIEIRPGHKGKLDPIRIVAQRTSVTDRQGRRWAADSYYRYGRAVTPAHEVKAGVDPDLYRGERFGAFTYSIPVPEGKYGLTLHFAESWFKEPGNRVFDVYLNGTALLRSFDIVRQAGGPNRGVAMSFHGIQPNTHGQILLNFVPTKNYALLNAIEVVDESE